MRTFVCVSWGGGGKGAGRAGGAKRGKLLKESMSAAWPCLAGLAILRVAPAATLLPPPLPAHAGSGFKLVGPKGPVSAEGLKFTNPSGKTLSRVQVQAPQHQSP